MTVSDGPEGAASAQEIKAWMDAYIRSVIDVPDGDFPFETSFDELGLDSVELTIMAGMLEEAFGIEIEPRDFVDNVNVATLAAHVQQVMRTNGRKAASDSV